MLGKSRIRAQLAALRAETVPDEVTAKRQRFAAFTRAASLPWVAELGVMIAGDELRSVPDSKQLHFRAHGNLVGRLLFAQQLLRDGHPTNSERDYVIDCLNRAMRWEDTWTEPVGT